MTKFKYGDPEVQESRRSGENLEMRKCNLQGEHAYSQAQNCQTRCVVLINFKIFQSCSTNLNLEIIMTSVSVELQLCFVFSWKKVIKSVVVSNVLGHQNDINFKIGYMEKCQPSIRHGYHKLNKWLYTLILIDWPDHQANNYHYEWYFVYNCHICWFHITPNFLKRFLNKKMTIYDVLPQQYNIIVILILDATR